MKKLLTLAMVLSALLIAVPVSADPGILYVDDDGLCGGNLPCYTHPQDAVNDANPGDTILVHPGTYGSRRYTSPTPPHWSAPNDQYAPALIVYKNGLTMSHSVIASDRRERSNLNHRNDPRLLVQPSGDSGLNWRHLGWYQVCRCRRVSHLRHSAQRRGYHRQ